MLKWRKAQRPLVAAVAAAVSAIAIVAGGSAGWSRSQADSISHARLDSAAIGAQSSRAAPFAFFRSFFANANANAEGDDGDIDIAVSDKFIGLLTALGDRSFNTNTGLFTAFIGAVGIVFAPPSGGASAIVVAALTTAAGGGIAVASERFALKKILTQAWFDVYSLKDRDKQIQYMRYLGVAGVLDEFIKEHQTELGKMAMPGTDKTLLHHARDLAWNATQCAKAADPNRSANCGWFIGPNTPQESKLRAFMGDQIAAYRAYQECLKVKAVTPVGPFGDGVNCSRIIPKVPRYDLRIGSNDVPAYGDLKDKGWQVSALDLDVLRKAWDKVHPQIASNAVPPLEPITVEDKINAALYALGIARTDSQKVAALKDWMSALTEREQQKPVPLADADLMIALTPIGMRGDDLVARALTRIQTASSESEAAAIKDWAAAIVVRDSQRQVAYATLDGVANHLKLDLKPLEIIPPLVQRSVGPAGERIEHEFDPATGRLVRETVYDERVKAERTVLYGDNGFTQTLLRGDGKLELVTDLPALNMKTLVVMTGGAVVLLAEKDTRTGRVVQTAYVKQGAYTIVIENGQSVFETLKGANGKTYSYDPGTRTGTTVDPFGRMTTFNTNSREFTIDFGDGTGWSNTGGFIDTRRPDPFGFDLVERPNINCRFVRDYGKAVSPCEFDRQFTFGGVHFEVPPMSLDLSALRNADWDAMAASLLASGATTASDEGLAQVLAVFAPPNADGYAGGDVVLPGEVVRIVGRGLASAAVASRALDECQTAFGGRSVMLGNSTLCLIAVGPDEIVARLPNDIPLGEQRQLIINDLDGTSRFPWGLGSLFGDAKLIVAAAK